MDPALRLQPGQEALTPVQEAEARRFAQACIQNQLSTDPVDEQEAEAWLRQAYAVAGLPPPQRIRWLDGPRQRDALLYPPYLEDNARASVWDRLKGSIRTRMRDHLQGSIRGRVWASLRATVRDPIRASVWDRVGASIGHSIWGLNCANGWDTISAYEQTSWLAFARFFAVYLAPNEFQALARFNELVSDYWLGNGAALIVRRPRVLSLDAAGRLHSATGRCIEYRDGGGGYAWHGVAVSQKIILAPEALTREDFLNELNAEVRRVIQERMGEQFLAKVGGVLIDSGPPGALYEVALPLLPNPGCAGSAWPAMSRCRTPRPPASISCACHPPSRRQPKRWPGALACRWRTMAQRRRREVERRGIGHDHSLDAYPSRSRSAHSPIPFYVRDSQRWPNILTGAP